MGPKHRGGTFSPAQSLITASNHSPHGSFSSGPSPSTNSPTSNAGASVHRITIAQVFLLLSTIKEGKNWEQQAEQLRKLLGDQPGMETFQPYFTRLVLANAPQIFPGVSRSNVANAGAYGILVEEIRKISQDVEQPRRIAEAIETSTDDIFQDFDLSTFMDSFKLDAFEKTILALAFKTGTKPNLKAKADAILSTNYSNFLQIFSQPTTNNPHGDLPPTFIATILDRYIQVPPPTFDQQAKTNMLMAAHSRYPPDQGAGPDMTISAPPEVGASLQLLYLLDDQHIIVTGMHNVGSDFTKDEETCLKHLQNSIPASKIDEDQVAAALLYAAISKTHEFSATVLVAAVSMLPRVQLQWQRIVKWFDRPNLLITPSQFLAIFNALLPIAQEGNSLDIQQLWSGVWQHPETQLSFVRAFCLQTPDQLDVSSIPGFQPSFSLEDYEGARQAILERATQAVGHPLVSISAIIAIFDTALINPESTEAARLFQDVVSKNLDIFIVSAFGIPKPWPAMAYDTLGNLYSRFFWKQDQHWEFVLYSIWQKDKTWTVQFLMGLHEKSPLELPIILEHAHNFGWLDELVQLYNGFGMELVGIAHARKLLDLNRWRMNAQNQRKQQLFAALMTFLQIKSTHEASFHQQHKDGRVQAMHLTTPLPVRTVYALLNIADELAPKPPGPELLTLQRNCVTAYPRLVNYGQGFDDILDANGEETNILPREANAKMEDHYKLMYSDEIRVRDVIDHLEHYKHSRNPFEQDVFACMIHGLFDEYQLYNTYPLEALATTAVLFGGIIAHKLLSDIPMEVGLGMILEAVRENRPEEHMYKFGLQALMQLLGRFHEWPGFCEHLLQIPGLQGTEAWRKAEEVSKEHEEEMKQRGVLGNGNPNGVLESMLPPEPTLPAFASLHVEPSKYDDKYEEPSSDTQEKVVFVLNNTTEGNLEDKLKELREVIEEKYQGWFAGHLVEQRAKMQPNYTQLYLDLLHQFNSKVLYYEVLRETYRSVIRMLNAESTMQLAPERSHLKNLAAWLGLLTLARDKPILHKNIAFKQLLIEAFDTQRLIVVIPFVCKVLAGGAKSVVFKPPNPWLMDIVHLLIELYHHAELKLNLKFEIEVLCKSLNLDHKSIEPSTDIQSRILPVEEPPMDPLPMDSIDNRFGDMSLTGASGTGRFSPNDIVGSVPDLGPLLSYPPPNEMVNQQALHEVVRAAITRAVHEIITPVVERSVTIAAISTAQMIRKDFATEPDEARVRAAAISMVKRTAGSLALVTSKEPLRASMSNYIRQMQGQLNQGQGLPEGTILMCVNSNIDMACAQVEKKAEEKAVPEIEDMIETELENRRQHKLLRPSDPYIDPGLSRWGMTIPDPYKLAPTPRGLNPEQMSIYEEFARQRVPIPAATGPSMPDANAKLPIDSAFNDQFPPPSNLPTPGETVPHIMNHVAQRGTGLTNGQHSRQQMDPRFLVESIQKLLGDLLRHSAESPELRYEDLPHSHPVIEIIDRLCSIVITSPRSEASAYTAEQICHALFSRELNDLAIESLVHLLGQLCKMHPEHTGALVVTFIARQPDENIINVSLALALLRTDFGLLDWHRLDQAVAKAIAEHKDGAIEFLSSMMDRVLFNDRPSALHADFVQSLAALGLRNQGNPESEVARDLLRKLNDSGILQNTTDSKISARPDHMEYVFEEWVHVCSNPNAPKNAAPALVAQIHQSGLLRDPDASVLFYRMCIDISVDRFEQLANTPGNANEAYACADALGKLIARFVVYQQDDDASGAEKSSKTAYLSQTLGVVALVLNQHQMMRGESFNQKVFFRLFSTMMLELNRLSAGSPAGSLKGLGAVPEAVQHENTLIISQVLFRIQPSYQPGFVFAWLDLITHRAFLPNLMRIPDRRGWVEMIKHLEVFFQFLGELLKPLSIGLVARDLYRAGLKTLLVFQHDYPDFLCEYHLALCSAIPTHAVQLQNMILSAKPATYFSLPNPLESSLKMERLEETHEHPRIRVDTEAVLRSANLLELLSRTLKSGPSEASVAHIAHTIQQKNGSGTTIGFMPAELNLILVYSVVLFVGEYSIRRASQESAPTFVSGSSDMALLSMLAKELKPEARYYFIIGIVNQLRFPSSHTYYFSSVLLDLFGMDMNDPESTEVRQQIVRVLLERISTTDNNQPWGLLATVSELLKNPKYMFFELPFVANQPEVSRAFSAFYPIPMH